LLTFIAVGCVVLVLMALTQFVLMFVAPAVPATLDGRTGGSTPQKAVQGYLEAVAGGHASAALEFAATLPANQAFLSDAVLKASHATAPITGITTPSASGNSKLTVVVAHYKIGSTAVSANVEVTKYGRAWYLESVTGTVDLSAIAASVPVKVAGVSTGNAPSVDVFPGAYAVTSADAMVALPKTTAVVGKPGQSDLVKAKPALSATAVTKIRVAAKTKLAACLAQKTLTPRGCGYSIEAPTDGTIDTSTITWTQTGGDILAIKPALTSDGLPFASASTSVTLKFHADATRANYYYRGTVRLTKVDILVWDANDIVVTFEPG